MSEEEQTVPQQTKEEEQTTEYQPATTETQETVEQSQQDTNTQEKTEKTENTEQPQQEQETQKEEPKEEEKQEQEQTQDEQKQEETTDGDTTTVQIESKKASRWGSWGEAPEEKLVELAQSEPVKRGHDLLPELAVDDPNNEETREAITGPDGYTYPPLTKAGIDILRRMWNGELPDNRVESVELWEGKVRCAVSMGLAIPVPPRVPATELLNRPAAAIKAESANKDLSKWLIPEEDPDSVSPELKDFRENGLNPETVTSLLDRRLEARSSRNYGEADRIREDLFAMGVEFNDVAMQWRCGEHKGSFGQNFTSPSHPQNQGNAPPPEVQEIDMPGTWEQFLGLPDPKVLAVGPRSNATGKRAWGAGGVNWGVNDPSQAAAQAIQNCIAQGVHRPKIVWPPHMAGAPVGGSGKGSGKGGKGYKGGKGKGSYQRY